jgi:hypothetical protein
VGDEDAPAGQIDASMTVVIYCEGELEGDA